jgi:hypothetical protein
VTQRQHRRPGHLPTRPEDPPDPLLGDRWGSGDGEPLSQHRTRIELYRLEAALRGLDLMDTDRGSW